MADMTSKADLGDIIRSEKFAYGRYNNRADNKGYLKLDMSLVEVDGKTQTQMVGYIDPNSTYRNRRDLELDVGAYDTSRAAALYVVEDAKMDGGGTAMFNDSYPDGWHVTARRLDQQGEYDPNGELIRFYQSGCFTNNIGEVERVGKMRRIFVSEPEDIWHNK